MTNDAFSSPSDPDNPPPSVRLRPAYGGPFDGLALLPPPPGGHAQLLTPGTRLGTPVNLGAATHLLLGGNDALREHWCYALALGPHRPTPTEAVGQVAGVYTTYLGLDLHWCALHPPCFNTDRPAGRWRLRALLVWWEALSLLELYHLVGGLPDVIAVRDAWRGVRDVEQRTWALAKALHIYRDRRRRREDGAGDEEPRPGS